ncbi:DUF5317 domain-containing protein [Aquibacillus koreensis]|uniref:DUF5317 domain-containing protein n=1 Tax=Aquibacillus koreensis TaxID=279446 RepID=A0A9X3WM16_9BACI|nr:DUF5317 domain-containing protein [Aquibacillus koreensis]MCT2535382.1 DUF5317 domain-containing protein [Aquibacillus koreensis]MDC3422547.1 DUF5317 domain-containing protein [Aquibacillus koreensis]
MVFDGIIFSFIIGFLRRGSLKGIGELKIKFGWIFPLLLVIQLFIYSYQERFEWLGSISSYLFILIYIIGLYFLYAYRDHPGFVLIFIGVLLNFIVMVINGGRMPVSLDAAAVLDPMYADALINGLYGKHQAITESTRLGFLGDVIPISNPYPRDQVISIGDIIMNIGIFIFIQHLMLKHNRLLTEGTAVRGGK